MRAVRFHRHGPPADVLRLDTLPVPEPGPGDVRVRFTHRPIHPSDLSAVAGTYGALRALPAVAGNEGAGVVEAIGAGVETLRVGQRVLKLGEAPTWQEQAVLPEADVFAVPDGVDDATAAQLFVNPLTAWLLWQAAPLAAGDTVVQTAGASTVARCVLALAQQAGVRSVHVVRSDTHADRLRALGAVPVVARDNSEATRAALSEAVGPSGARAVYDAVAGEAGALALSALADGGTHVVYGALSRAPLPVAPAALIYRAATVLGVWRSRWVRDASPDQVREALGRVASLAADGLFSLPVEAAYSLASVAEAVQAATAPGRWGKVLLVD